MGLAEVIIDSSAIVAILRAEPERVACANAIAAATIRRVSAVSYVEASVVIEGKRNLIAIYDFDDFFHESGIVIEPVTAEQAWIARAAYRAYGKGSGHPAQLNLGDVFAYALAKTMREPLLYLRDDFVYTDIESAIDQ
jgi:ribonuclease VapC